MMIEGHKWKHNRLEQSPLAVIAGHPKSFLVGHLLQHTGTPYCTEYSSPCHHAQMLRCRVGGYWVASRGRGQRNSPAECRPLKTPTKKIPECCVWMLVACEGHPTFEQAGIVPPSSRDTRARLFNSLLLVAIYKLEKSAPALAK